MAQAWYAFRTYNSQNIYGFGTMEEAGLYQDILNKGRDIDRYSALELDADEAAHFGLDGDKAINLVDELAARAGDR